MNPGRMDCLVSILTVTNGRDAAGGPTETWTACEPVFAEKDDQTGREFQAAAQTNAAQTTRFWLRWQPGITPANRIRLLGDDQEADRDYDINYVREVGRRDGLEITATARV